ncbi:MAG TPA: DNA polymerase I [Coriobacteriia bacterium]|nr:DNA polymerase I [Coriobacteriia bacterium]
MPQRTIAVIDGNSLLHRAFHALPESMTAPDGRPTNAAYGFISMLLKLMADIRPDGLVVAFDRGMPAFRREALQQYKVHRPPTAESLKAQFPMVKHLLESMSVPIVEIEQCEGDDVLGTLAKRGTEQGMRVLLVTGDRDAYQLVNENVSVVTTKKGVSEIVVFGPAEVYERYGVTPSQVPDYLGLKGDTSDNIPGVPGIGEKTAAKLLQQYGDMDTIIASAEEIGGRAGASIAENEEAARASRTVATIWCDVPIELDLASVEFGHFDRAALAQAFGELRFTSMLDRVLALAAPGDGAGDAGPAVGASEAGVPAAACRDCVKGAAAETAMRGWMQTGDAWLGVAMGVPTDTLFADSRELAVAGPGAVAVSDGDGVPALLGELLAGARVAAADVKALAAEICPPDESEACRRSLELDDAKRLFDCGIAAYLLESNRSSYDLSSLHADYLGTPAPQASDQVPEAAVAAQLAADLAPELERRLEQDGSTGVFRDIEMPLVPVLLHMERVGVGLDTSVLASLAEETHTAIDRLRGEIFELAGVEFVIDSPKQLAEVLFEKLQLPVQKRTKTGFSTDASVLAALAPLHPIAEKIVSYREMTKLTSTYLEALPRMVRGDRRLHTSFNQTVAATGRLSSSNPNLQNIPVRTDFGRRIRAAFVPAEAGDVIVAADYSQIELRILAHLSADQGLIDAFTSGEDFHTATAARVFGVDPDALEPGMRARAKAVNFGIVYGQSAHGLADTLKITHVEAQGMIDRYYAAYPGVRRYLDETVASAHRDGFATTLYGRKRRIPELMSSNYNLRSFGERTAMNHPMQGTAADIMKLAMIEVHRKLHASGLSARMVLQVHDELVFESPVAEVEALSALVCEAMSGVAALSVPLEVSVGSGPDWAQAK